MMSRLPVSSTWSGIRRADMHTLICGSIAYDTIMVFEDRFKRHILPDKIHVLNVAFLVPEMTGVWRLRGKYRLQPEDAGG